MGEQRVPTLRKHVGRVFSESRVSHSKPIYSLISLQSHDCFARCPLEASWGFVRCFASAETWPSARTDTGPRPTFARRLVASGQTMPPCGNATGALYIARHSHCPGEQWHEEVARLPHGMHGEELHFVNIGANKGYNFVAFYQRYARAMQSQPLSFTRWHALLRRNFSGDAAPACEAQCCGVCNDCKGTERRGPRDARRLRMHALEAAPVNAAILQRVVQQSGLEGVVTVHATGASDSADAPLYARFNTKPGYEGNAVSLASRGTRIATTTADLFFAAAHIPHAHMVTIDTEGWDGRVLAGMRATLTAKRHAAAARTRATPSHALPAGQRRITAAPFVPPSPPPVVARAGWTCWSSSTASTGGNTGGNSRSRPRSPGCCAWATGASGRGGISTGCSRPRPVLAGRRGLQRSTRRPGVTSSAAIERTCSPCSKGARLGQRGGRPVRGCVKVSAVTPQRQKGETSPASHALAAAA